MSYAKMMRKSMRSKIRCYKKSGKMFGQSFTVLGPNERHKEPWLGSAWFEPDMEQERADCIAEYHAETERLLKINSNLKLV